MPGMMDTVLNLGLNPETSGPDRADGQRALRLGRVAPLRRDVRADRARPEGRGLRRALRRGQARGARRKLDTDLTAEQLREIGGRVHGDRAGEDAGSRSRPIRIEQLELAIARRLRLLVRQARPRLPRVQQDPPRPGHGGQRRDDGLRQHGRRLGHRRRLHARPEHRRARDLRRVPDQRPGRGRRGRHPHARRRSARCATSCPRSTPQFEEIAERLEQHYRDMQDLEFTIERGKLYMLQTRSGEADRAGRGEDRRRHGQRGGDHQGGGAPAGRARADRPAPAPAVRRGRRRARAGGPAAGQGPERLARRRRRAGDLRPGPRRRGEGGRRAGDPGARSRPRPRTSTACSPRRASSPLAAGRPPRRGRGARRWASRASPAPRRSRSTTRSAQMRAGDGDRRARATMIASTARPARSSPASFPRSRRASRTSTTWRRCSAGPTRSAGCRSGPTRTTRATPSARARSAPQGIGLCRTEHMFFEEERLPTVRRMILAATPRDRRPSDDGPPATALGGRRARRSPPSTTRSRQLERLQTDDFAGLFRAMDGLPVVIRLIDPPLHEFLPSHDELLRRRPDCETRRRRGRGPSVAAELAEAEELLARGRGDARAEPDARPARLPPRAHVPRHRQDADAGHPRRRGARRREGATPLPEIMIPLVGHVNELRATREILEAEVAADRRGRRAEVDYKFGTMIEVPRGASSPTRSPSTPSSSASAPTT